MHLFAPPPETVAALHLSLPDRFRRTGQHSAWADINKAGEPIDSFLEGPAFDNEGNLYFVDIPWGRIFRASPDGELDVVAEYRGEPNGLKVGADGLLYVADYENGIMRIDPATGQVTPHCTRFRLEAFKGCNDLTWGRDGSLYFTDQGQTGHQDPTGRVFRLSPDGRLDLMLGGIPSPNGLVMHPGGKILYVAVTRANAVWRLPIMGDGCVSKVGTFIQLSGGLAGPDGIAITADGGLVVAHAGLGTVWVFDPIGQPLHRVRVPEGLSTTNIAFGGPDNRTLFITESETGTIWRADLPVTGAAVIPPA